MRDVGPFFSAYFDVVSSTTVPTWNDEEQPAAIARAGRLSRSVISETGARNQIYHFIFDMIAWGLIFVIPGTVQRQALVRFWRTASLHHKQCVTAPRDVLFLHESCRRA